ncbi:MAG: hypothetical protein OEY34_02680 [Cyclobacteriaceae bacterium]|nr:hypothetical protein [Cyclobacteriaceae bacterium]
MDITHRIWHELVTSSYQAIYSSIYNSRIRNFSDRLNLFTSIVTSASVGGWAIWDEYPGLWGVIIALSQLVNIAKPYISSIRDYELYHEMQMHYQELHFELDKLWLQISMGRLTTDEIADGYEVIYQKYFDLSKKFLKTRVPFNNTMEEKAMKEWNKYLGKYGINEEKNE